MVPIAYASSEGSDEPVHLRKIVSAFRLNCEHRKNVDEGTFMCLFWKEKSSNMDGFSFHLDFLQKIGRSL